MHGSLFALPVRDLDTRFGRFRATELRSLRTHQSAFALVRGDVSGDAPVLTRVHSSCVTSEFLGACDCDCAAQLDGALEAIDSCGRGVLIYLAQEGRGAGLLAKARDRMLVQASRQRMTTFEAYERMGLSHDLRSYEDVASACQLLGVSAPLLLLTNNPHKVAALEREKLRVAETVALEHDATPFNAHYLQAKRRSGHTLAADPAGARAELPERVRSFEPQPLTHGSDLIRVASYLLPVAGARAERDRVLWLHAHFHLDLLRGATVSVLCTGLAPGVRAIARIQPEPVLERFALRAAPERAAWCETLNAIEECGAGCVVVAPRDASGRRSATERDGLLVDLLAYYLRQGSALPLVEACDDPSGAPLVRALRQRGVDLDGARELPERARAQAP